MKKYLYILLGIVVFVGVVFIIVTPAKASIYDDFAKCIKSKNVIFYGAFWCPHCQAQKAEFGTAVQYLPYVECSTPDGQSQTQVCQDAGIMTYPTWQFPAGLDNSTTTTREVGVMQLSDLSTRTDCPLPATQ